MLLKPLRIVCVILALATLPGAASASITVHFDSPAYQVQPLSTVQVQISYDADPNTPGDQPLPGGLFRASLRCAT